MQQQHMAKWRLLNLAGLGASVAILLLLGSLAVSAENTPGGTIPPLEPFRKTVRSESGDISRARIGEKAIYEIEFRNEISPSYSGKIGITDIVAPGLQLMTETITATSGNIGYSEGVLTWTLTVEYSQSYVLSYTVSTPLSLTVPSTITSEAVLYEIENLDGSTPPTPLTKTASSQLVIDLWKLHLPLTMRVLPNNGNFEQGRRDWAEIINGTTPGKLIYSTQESPLAMIDGSFYGWLGGIPNQTNELSQTFRLASPLPSLKLRYLYWIQSDEDTCSDAEVAEVRVNGDPLETYQLCKQNRTFDETKGHGWRRGVLELAGYQGNMVTLTFFTRLNGAKNSNFFVDVVQLCSDDTDAPAGTVKCTDPPTP